MAHARNPELFSRWCKLLLDADRHTGRDSRYESKEKKDGELVDNDLFLGQSAFLGPTLWDKTLPVDVSDFKLEYMDLDEFLNENGLVDNPENNNKKEDAVSLLPTAPQQQQPQPTQQESPAKPSPVEPQQPTTSNEEEETQNLNSNEPDVVSQPKSPVVVVDFDIPASDLALATIPGSESDSIVSSCPSSPDANVNFDVPDGDLALVTIPGQQFDPKKRAFSEEELRPQPMIKKSKKVFVPEDLKDDRYWQRRKKNNVAAKRSRDARRIKENQIAMRASFLERQSDKLREDLEQMKSDNKILMSRLLKYEPDFKL